MASRRVVAVWIGCVAAACAGGVPASPEQQALAERRLLEPFLAAREVGCGELLVEVTGNFYNRVGRPAFDANRHSMSRENGDGFVDTVWTNTTGTADAAFLVTIGENSDFSDQGWVAGKRTQFRVVNQVRLRVYEGRRAMTLNATAGGAFVFVKEASGAPREVRNFAIADGVLRQP